jgi:nicotinamidase-related amidase
MQPPELPAPVAVSLDPATTALLVLDITDLTVKQAPTFETLPAVKRILEKGRAAGARVVFSLGRAPEPVLYPELGRRETEPIVKTSADKFFGTELARLLEGIAVAIVCGTAANGAVLYTAFGCCARGLSVVVPEDAISSREPFATQLARYQLLNQPGFPNPHNKPLAPKAVTLSRSDLVTFTGAG